MGHLEFSRNVDCWQRQILVAQMLGPVWKWFRNAAEIVGEQPMDVGMAWTPARRELIDPQKEVGAIIEAVRGGLMSLSEAIRRSGYEPGEVMAEIARDAAMLDELGLVLDTDPRNVTAAGMIQTTGAVVEEGASDGQRQRSRDQPEANCRDEGGGSALSRLEKRRARRWH